MKKPTSQNMLKSIWHIAPYLIQKYKKIERDTDDRSFLKVY
jgi:hypothetical protein